MLSGLIMALSSLSLKGYKEREGRNLSMASFSTVRVCLGKGRSVFGKGRIYEVTRFFFHLELQMFGYIT